MRALVQRVSEASVTVDGEEVARIGPGLLVLLGVRRATARRRPTGSPRKLLALRVFEDAEGKMNLSVRDVGGELLVVSQFTLYGDAQGQPAELRGRCAARGGRAALRARARRARRPGRRLRRPDGRDSVNDGPVTLLEA